MSLTPLTLVVPTVVSLLATPAALAEIVHLKDGHRVEGRLIEETPERLKIETRTGIQTIPRADIESVERVKTDWEEYRERAAILDSKDADGHYQLGLWCRAKRLPAESLGEFKKAIAAAPDHAGARKELGYVKKKSGWVKEAEGSPAQPTDEPKTDEAPATEADRGPIAGFVKVGTQWMTPEDQRERNAGRVRYKGIWMSPEDREKRKQHLVFEGGEWVPVEQADKGHKSWSDAWVITTNHYELRTNTSREFADDVAEIIELCFPEMARLFGGPPTKRMKIYLFNLQQELVDYLNTHKLERFAEMDGFFDAQSLLVLGWSGRESDFIRRFLLGPVAFQYYYFCHENALPSWLTSAVGYYFRTNKLEKGILTPGLPNRVVLKEFDRAVKTDNLIPLAKLMRMEMFEAFDRGLIEIYDAESYLLFLYLTRSASPDLREKFQDWIVKLRKGPFILGNADPLSADWWRDAVGKDRFAAFEAEFFDWAKKEVATELSDR